MGNNPRERVKKREGHGEGGREVGLEREREQCAIVVQWTVRRALFVPLSKAALGWS